MRLFRKDLLANLAFGVALLILAGAGWLAYHRMNGMIDADSHRAHLALALAFLVSFLLLTAVFIGLKRQIAQCLKVEAELCLATSIVSRNW